LNNIKLEIDKLKNKLSETIRDNLQVNTNFYRTLGDYIVQVIRNRTRQGYGVDVPRGTKKPLKPLSSKYINYRIKYKNLSSETNPGTSNLTLTGHMLDSLTSIATNKYVRIDFTDKFAKDKAKWNAESKEKRIFMNLSSDEYKDISEIVKDYLLEKINLAIKKEFR